MKHMKSLRHVFVEYIPTDLKDGTIYVSVTFATAAHKCCCGCGREVVTPLSPTDWNLVFDGESISLDPSIGNWNFACRSHYWIIRNKVKWAKRWSPEEIDAGRAYDSLAKERYFSATKTPADHNTSANGGEPGYGKPNEGVWRKLIKWFRRK
jgi:hypothetical protein